MSSSSAQAAVIGEREMLDFAAIRVSELEALSADRIDGLPYGVVGLAPDGTAEVYNATESRLAGIPRSIVLGWSYFAETAQCMDNARVAGRFEAEPEIDDVIDYVLTLRMRPTPVRLRLLKSPSCARRYLLIQR